MKVLIVRITSMGDIIHTLPALSDAAKQIPNIQFDWVVEKGFDEIPRWHNAVNNVWPVSMRKLKKHPFTIGKDLVKIIRVMRSQKYDLIIDSQGLIKSMLLATLCKGPTAGYDKNSIKEKVASYAYKHQHSVSKNQHAIARNRQLFAKALDYAVPLEDSSIDYGIAASKLFDANIAPGRYIIFLHGTTWRSKNWPLSHWIQLAKIAEEHGHKVEITHADPWQTKRALAMGDAQKNIVVNDMMTINQAAKWIAGATAVVSVDTGFGHLAAALKIPVVSIFGATDPVLAGIYGEKDKYHIFHEQKLDCAPCLLKQCSLSRDDSVCMTGQQPVAVWDKLKTLL